MAEVQASDRPFHPTPYPPPNDATVSKPPVSPAPLPAPSDVMSATIESLRARLLAERAASKEARQQAQRIAERVSKLQARLDAEIEQRRKSELAMLELLEVLKAKGLPLQQVICTVPLPLETLECEEIGLLVNGSRSGDSEQSYGGEVLDSQLKEEINGSGDQNTSGSEHNKEECLQKQAQVQENVIQAQNDDSSPQEEGKTEHHKDDQLQEAQMIPVDMSGQQQDARNYTPEKVDELQEAEKDTVVKTDQCQEIQKDTVVKVDQSQKLQKDTMVKVDQSQEAQKDKVDKVDQSQETEKTQQKQELIESNKSNHQPNTGVEKVNKGESEQGEHGPSEGSAKQDSSSETESQASSKLYGALPSSARLADQRGIYSHETHSIPGVVEQPFNHESLSGNTRMQHPYFTYGSMLHSKIPPVNGNNPYDVNDRRNSGYYMHALQPAELHHLKAPYISREPLASDLYASQQSLVNDSVMNLVDDKRGKLGDILAALNVAKQQLKDEGQLSYFREERFKPSMPAANPTRFPGYDRNAFYQPQSYRYMRPEAPNQSPIVHLPPSPKSDHGVSPFDRHEGLRRSSSVSANFMMPGSYFQSKGELHLGNGITLYTD